MQVEKLWQFPIKEFHRMPRGILGPGAYEMVGVEAKKLGFKRSLLATSGLRAPVSSKILKEKLSIRALMSFSTIRSSQIQKTITVWRWPICT